MAERHKTTELEFLLRSSESNGLHVGIVLQIPDSQPVSSDTPFSCGAERDVFETVGVDHWRRVSTGISWCHSEENLCKHLACLAMQAEGD